MLDKCDLNHEDQALLALGVVNDVLRLVQLLQRALMLPKPMLPKLLTARTAAVNTVDATDDATLKKPTGRLTDDTSEKEILAEAFKKPLVNCLLTKSCQTKTTEMTVCLPE